MYPYTKPVTEPNPDTGKDTIAAKDKAAHCVFCEQIFKRLRGTLRYCNQCGRAFCEGEHGTFAGGRGGVCIKCFKLD